MQNNILKFALFGAAGFGLGGLLYGISIQTPLPGTSFYVLLTLFGFAAQAGVGGLALAMALGVNPPRALKMVLFCIFGFLAARYLLLLPLFFVIGDRFSGNPPESYVLNLLLGFISGVGAGIGIWLSSGLRRSVGLLILSGGIGFGFGLLITTPLYYGLSPQHWLGYTVAGTIGGGVLGAAMGSMQTAAVGHEKNS
ncbi:hypothetical protein [Dehalogenimonas alkenigignens]|uniref:Uncharacterized protein n=1 Tax=Dehalogenimonas alkenigignens TaxID=1217799 RepID=A0A0W0GGN5_9CHLR|nr:hypothetical protein [Dehalogenimonas alkenigignens]KTB47691.1 hypothetical protein DEALK_05360 [Dehalogenimonas alkenigignens]